ncbi:MAG: co-chaperone GroES [Bacilli bacterium]|jgi:chaperonin GroES
MNKQLLGNRVLIEADISEKKTASGVIIAKTEEMGDYMTGTVFLVGEGKMNERGELLPMKVKKDDKVIFQYGKSIQVEGKMYTMVVEDDIIYII